MQNEVLINGCADFFCFWIFFFFGEIQVALKCIHNILVLLGSNTTDLGLLSWFDLGLILLLIIKIINLIKCLTGISVKDFFLYSHPDFQKVTTVSKYISFK